MGPGIVWFLALGHQKPFGFHSGLLKSSHVKKFDYLNSITTLWETQASHREEEKAEGEKRRRRREISQPRSQRSEWRSHMAYFRHTRCRVQEDWSRRQMAPAEPCQLSPAVQTTPAEAPDTAEQRRTIPMWPTWILPTIWKKICENCKHNQTFIVLSLHFGVACHAAKENEKSLRDTSVRQAFWW